MPSRMPDFLIIGAMKAGTTSLFRYLGDRDDVFTPVNKEPEFFVESKTWKRGVEWYAGQFSHARPDQMVGEASTSYTKALEFPGVPARIAGVLPEVRLVYLLREPVARTVSMYRHQVLMGVEHRPVDQALLDPCYVDPSCYARQIEAYDDHVKPERMLVVTTESLANDPAAVVNEVAAFLGLPARAAAGLGPRRDNASDARRAETTLLRWARRTPGVQEAARRVPRGLRRALERPLTRTPPAAHQPCPATVERLRDQLRPDVARLRDRLGPGFTGWGLVD